MPCRFFCNEGMFGEAFSVECGGKMRGKERASPDVRGMVSRWRSGQRGERASWDAGGPAGKSLYRGCQKAGISCLAFDTHGYPGFGPCRVEASANAVWLNACREFGKGDAVLAFGMCFQTSPPRMTFRAGCRARGISVFVVKRVAAYSSSLRALRASAIFCSISSVSSGLSLITFFTASRPCPRRVSP